MKKIFGNIINPLNKHKIEFIKDGCLLINNDGIIEKKGKKNDFQKINCASFDYGTGFIVPGFIDMHTHIPQFPMIGSGKGELLEWLEKYILPAEERFADIDYVKSVFDEFVISSLKFGTTTSVAFSSVHKAAQQFLIDNNHKIRLFSGNSMMDIGEGSLVNTKDVNIGIMKQLKDYSNNSENYTFIATPRYAGNCSFELLKETAEYAKNQNLYIQTHLSENRNEIKYIMDLHPDFKDYTDIYHRAGLLSEKTILAHCIYLSESELETVYNAGSVIAHCPTSNIYLKSGIMPLKSYLKKGMKIGVGTDIAAGYTLDMRTEIRNAIESSKILSVIKDEDLTVTPEEIFPHTNILAAKYLNISDSTGNLETGKFADFSIIKNARNNSDLESALVAIIYDDRNETIATYYKGEKVY